MSDEKELKDQRIPIMMSGSELRAVDDWSFNNRIRSRGEAIRRLCQIALLFDRNMPDIIESVNSSAQATKETLEVLVSQDEEVPASFANLVKATVSLSVMMKALKQNDVILKSMTSSDDFSKYEAVIQELEKATKKIISDLDVEIQTDVKNDQKS